MSLAEQNKNVKQISDYQLNNEFSKILNIVDSADWHSMTIYLSNLLKVPVDHNLINKELTLLDNTVASKLGHKTLGSFITSSRLDKGLDLPWSTWENNVKASRYKSEFGINTTDLSDILNQVEDVKIVIGRFPLSQTEFNYGKGIIQEKSLQELHEEHSEQINVMTESMNSIMLQLDKERNDHFKVIEQLNSTLHELQMLKLNHKVEDLEENEIITNYVKKSMYEEIIRQMEEAEINFESCTQDYIDKVINLEKNEHDLRVTLETIQKNHAKAIERLRGEKLTQDESLASREEIIALKVRLAEALRNFLNEKKKSNKLGIISGKQKELISHYKEDNYKKSEAYSNMSSTFVIGAFAIASAAVVFFTALAYNAI